MTFIQSVLSSALSVPAFDFHIPSGLSRWLSPTAVAKGLTHCWPDSSTPTSRESGESSISKEAWPVGREKFGAKACSYRSFTLLFTGIVITRWNKERSYLPKPKLAMEGSLLYFENGIPGISRKAVNEGRELDLEERETSESRRIEASQGKSCQLD